MSSAESTYISLASVVYISSIRRGSPRSTNSSNFHFTNMLVTVPLHSQMVSDAYDRIARYVARTPVLTSAALSTRVALLCSDSSKLSPFQDTIQLFFKAENLQKTGSFKFRGALHSVISLPDEKLACGLATTSSGNCLLRRQSYRYQSLTYACQVTTPRPWQRQRQHSHHPQACQSLFGR
jgi:hypothetical protein